MEYLLHTQRITLGNIKFVLKASGHLAGDAFREPINLIEKAWGNCYSDLSKEAINCAIGLMGSRDNFLYSCLMSNMEEDAALLAGQSIKTQHGGIHTCVTRTKVVETWTMLPIYLFCLDFERLMVAKIVDIARSIACRPGRYASSGRTASS